MSSNNLRSAQAALGTELRALIRWAALVPEELPPPVVRRATMILGDDLAAAMAGAVEPEVVCVTNTLLRPGREATVFGVRPQRTDQATAAFLNALAADWMELDEGYRRAACHAGLYVLPALLAAAETSGATVRELLRALAVGYEVATRVARAFTFHAARPHPHALLSAVGAAAAVAALRRFDEAAFFAAVTSAMTFAQVGPYGHVTAGALVRNAWPAIGAWNGLHCADWAELGIGGIDATPHEVFEICLGAESSAEEMTVGLGTGWAVSDGYHKVYACCQHTHSAVEAVLDVRAELLTHGGAAAVEHIHVGTHPRAMLLLRKDPQNSLAAKFSLPHAVAAAIVYGDAAPHGFTGEALQSAEIARLRDRTDVTMHEPLKPPPLDRPAHLTITFTDGTVLASSCESAMGGPDRPLGEETVLEKIAALTASSYPKFAPALHALLERYEEQAARPWRAVVDEVCAL